jgi:hypothetical protein
MGTSLSKTQLLDSLRKEQAAWEALLDEIGEARMTQPEVAGGWSIKDIVAHASVLAPPVGSALGGVSESCSGLFTALAVRTAGRQ